VSINAALFALRVCLLFLLLLFLCVSVCVNVFVCPNWTTPIVFFGDQNGQEGRPITILALASPSFSVWQPCSVLVWPRRGPSVVVVLDVVVNAVVVVLF
jgi:hypothetical protein